jgi:hypothetical protein
MAGSRPKRLPVLFGFISRVRIGVRFAVDMFLPFAAWVGELKIPRTADRRSTPPFGSIRFGSWPALATIPSPIPRKLSGKIAEGQRGAADHQRDFRDGWHFCRMDPVAEGTTVRRRPPRCLWRGRWCILPLSLLLRGRPLDALRAPLPAALDR